MSSTARTLAWDWYAGNIPDNVALDDTAYIETTFSFYRYRSREQVGVRAGRGAATYLGTMFDVGPRGQVVLGDFTCSHGAWFISDALIEVGAYTLLSWNVVIMDSYRVATEPMQRRLELERAAHRSDRLVHDDVPARPVSIGESVWIGFDVCVLPGVTIGDGSIIGARSVVADDVPAYCVAAGNPARVIRLLTDEERRHVAR